MALKTQRRPDETNSDAGGGSRSSYWIFSPLQDVAFVLLTPLPILLAFAVARRGAWMNGLLTFGLALAMAHYLPGILRAYGDRALFRRFRTRLIVAPLFLVTITTWFAYIDLHIVILLALLWGQWHWMSQVYGFARIYDAKVKPSARTPARLDQTICIMWFGMCVFVLNNDLPLYVTRFYQSGGPRLPASAFAWFAWVWLAVTVALTLLYVVRTLWAIRDGRFPSPLKLLFLVTTFVYLSYTVSVVERPLMGLVLFESWHDIQYLAIVWLFNVNRARKGPEAGSFIRFLFRPRAILALAYLSLCLAFGALTHAWSLFENETVIRIAVSLVTATALLHYYLDGFIWKIRETETRQVLLGESRLDNLQPSAVLASSSRGLWPTLIPVWTRHALLWLLFVIPAALFFAMESKGNVPSLLAIFENVAEAFPNSPNAHYQLGRELMDGGRLREAKVHFERALAFAPDMLPAHTFLGVLLTDQGDLAGAQPHFELALKIDPENAEVHNNLGIVFDELGDLPRAREHLQHAVRIDPQYALAQNNLGIVLAKLGDLAQAQVHQEHAIRIAPDFADGHYQLGLTLARQRDLTGAVDHFEQALRIDAGHYLAHNSLGEALVSQDKLSEAKVHFEQALQIRRNYAIARENLATTEMALQNRVPAPGGR